MCHILLAVSVEPFRDALMPRVARITGLDTPLNMAGGRCDFFDDVDQGED